MNDLIYQTYQSITYLSIYLSIYTSFCRSLYLIFDLSIDRSIGSWSIYPSTNRSVYPTLPILPERLRAKGMTLHSLPFKCSVWENRCTGARNGTAIIDKATQNSSHTCLSCLCACLLACKGNGGCTPVLSLSFARAMVQGPAGVLPPTPRACAPPTVAEDKKFHAGHGRRVPKKEKASLGDCTPGFRRSTVMTKSKQATGKSNRNY